MKRFFTWILLLVIHQTLSGQVIKNSYIVDLKTDQTDAFLQDKRITSNSRVAKTKILSSSLDIVQVIVTEEEGSRSLEQWFDKNSNVESWSYNYYVQKREDPNDEYFGLQWGLELISAPDAWAVTTGGTDNSGNEIVIAVLDDSYDLTHPELEGRIFINEQEIPDDGIDNDNNGYIDDYQGWNTTDENDNHPLTDNHGIAVSGIIGAKTDNGLGMAGINWDVKILMISGIATQAEVIGGYQYALNMRKRYNESNGAEGAYVVVTNYSAGIDNKFGTDPQFKSWCDMYDAMGDVGILSCGATANKNVDVDADGDMPTTCPSEFLISVTNIDSDDTKVTNAGYGLLNIDVGAPGKGTLTLDTQDGFDQSFGGTSAATPHVAGTVGLLYSVPCSAISELAMENPRQAAQVIRDAIYNGVSLNSTLDGLTTTGGRIDIYGAIEVLQETCDDLNLPSPKGDLEIIKIDRSNISSFLIEYLTPDEMEYSILVTDRIGRTIQHLNFTPPTIGRKVLRLENLDLITGIYFISIYNDSNISTQKIFIE
ncbi:MAG: S8 family serine peptidase [Saprospiraceae bacterium]|nr:S8 family serine peptidase [Saprospiraceae bacterium]